MKRDILIVSTQGIGDLFLANVLFMIEGFGWKLPETEGATIWSHPDHPRVGLKIIDFLEYNQIGFTLYIDGIGGISPIRWTYDTTMYHTWNDILADIRELTHPGIA